MLADEAPAGGARRATGDVGGSRRRPGRGGGSSRGDRGRGGGGGSGGEDGDGGLDCQRSREEQWDLEKRKKKGH